MTCKNSSKTKAAEKHTCNCQSKGKQDNAAQSTNDQSNADFNTERFVAIRMAMQPKDTNGRGKIFGGRLLELIDLAGAQAAHRVCKNRFIRDMVTRVMNEVEFRQPVEVNDIVTCYSRVIKVGKTSVTVQVEVEADRAGTVIPVLSSTIVFVAVDENNRPTPIANGGCEGSSAEKPAAAPTTTPQRRRPRQRKS